MNQQQRTQCGQKLSQLFKVQIAQVTDYTDYLSNIKLAITHNETEQLNSLLQQPVSNPEIIEQSQAQQGKILAYFGYEDSPQGLSKCIQDCEDSGQLQLQADSLKEKLKTLEKSLLVNSLLVRKNQDRVRQSIRILSGHHQSSTPATYSRQGSTYNGINNKRSLAQA